MIPDMNLANSHIEYVKPISSFDAFHEEAMREALMGTKTQPLLQKNHQDKRTKTEFLAYRLQLILS